MGTYRDSLLNEFLKFDRFLTGHNVFLEANVRVKSALQKM